MWQPVDTASNRPIRIGTKDWPVLIHGTPKAGASFFTIALTASFLRRGEKVVFICAHAPAITALQREMHLTQPAMASATVTASAATSLEEMQLVTLMLGRGHNVLEALRALHDWTERIVIVKNIDEVLTSPMWAVLQSHRRCVLSGDLNKLRIALPAVMMKTQILFSDPPKTWPIKRSPLPTFMAEIHRSRGISTGLVREVAEV